MENINPYDTHGRPVAHVPEFSAAGREDRLTAVTPEHEGVTFSELVQIQDLRNAYSGLINFGLTVSPDIGKAFAVLDAIHAFRVAPQVPDIAGMSPEDALAALDTYARERVICDARDRGNRSTVEQAKGMIVYQALAQIHAALSAEIDSVLAQLQKPFTAAAKKYMEHSDIPEQFRTPADAAMADTDGSTVARWHRAREGAHEMQRISDLVLNLKGGRVSTPEVAPNLVTDFSAAENILVIAHADDRTEAGSQKTDTPFSHYPLILAAGGALALAKDSQEWADRTALYREKRDEAGWNLWR